MHPSSHFKPYELFWQPTEASKPVKAHGELYTSEAFIEAHHDLQESPEELVFAGLVQSGFLTPNGATSNCNWSGPIPDIVGLQPDYLGPVLIGPWTEKRLVWTGLLS